MTKKQKKVLIRIIVAAILISYFTFCSAGRAVAGIAVPDPLRGDRI